MTLQNASKEVNVYLFQAGPVEAVELLHSLELEPVLEQCKQCQGKVAGCATQILKLMQTTN